MSDLTEVNDLIRLYKWEWCVYRCEDPQPDETVQEQLDRLWTWFDTNMAGRVRREDVEVRLDRLKNEPPMAKLMIRMPVLKAEVKHLDTARRMQAEKYGPDSVLVVRNSQEDHHLRGYGVRMLPTS